MVTKEESKEEIKLSNEFKNDLKKESETKWAAIIGLSLAIVVVFGSLGIGTYEIFYKPEKVQQTVGTEDKIQSRPSEEEEVKAKETTPQTVAPKPAPTPATTPTTPGFEIYVVVEGDTLSGIATKYDTTSTAIAKYNGFESTEVLLSIGQKIKIPK